MRTQRILGCAIILGTLFVLSLIAAGALQHRASIHGPGLAWLRTDIGLLLLYGFAGVLVWKQKSLGAIAAALVGAHIGLLVGAVQVANHLIEALVPARPFLLVITPVFLTFALLGAADAAAWERTSSLPQALVAALSCAVVATLVTLGFAISFNLLFAARVGWQLREAFAASGMTDPAAFRVRNILEASSEILVRMPLMALCLAFVGAVIQAWVSRESRRVFRTAAGCLSPFVFAAGVAARWHANTIERTACLPWCSQEPCLSPSLCALSIPFGLRSTLQRAGRSAR